jgi:NADH:ubiquinone oxidoreductase subunit E
MSDMTKTCQTSKFIEKDGKRVQVCDETRAQLLPVLQAIQKKKGCISDRDMQEVADSLGIHPVEVYSVVTFYSFLSVEKKGKHVIRISNCMPCELKGSGKIVKEFETLLKTPIGTTTKDNVFSLEMTGCLGMCDQAPAIMIDETLIGKVTPAKVKLLIKEYKKK